MKFAAFDLETAAIIPDNVPDWSRLQGLGIACAALAVAGPDGDAVRFWEGSPRLTAAQAADLVQALADVRDSGATLLTWNGCGFDFRILAEESGMRTECALLAMQHVDLMLMVTFRKGWLLGLQRALAGAGLEGKRRRVTLLDGRVIDDMDGKMAPILWAAGEREAVLAYLNDDVVQVLRLAERILERGRIAWTSTTGKPQAVPVHRLLSVEECLLIPEPDTSWMADPPERTRFLDWM